MRQLCLRISLKELRFFRISLHPAAWKLSYRERIRSASFSRRILSCMTGALCCILHLSLIANSSGCLEFTGLMNIFAMAGRWVWAAVTITSIQPFPQQKAPMNMWTVQSPRTYSIRWNAIRTAIIFEICASFMNRENSPMPSIASSKTSITVSRWMFLRVTSVREFFQHGICAATVYMQTMRSTALTLRLLPDVCAGNSKF